MTTVEVTAEGRSAREVLAWSREMVEAALRPAADTLPASMRHIAGYHFGWWDEHGEPVQAEPVIVEDGAFIGSRCVVVEGVRIGRAAVLGAGVVLTSNTPLIDVTGDEPVEYRGEVPARSVVVPGTRPRSFPAGQYGLPCGLIIGRRGERTASKLRLNEALREFGLEAHMEEMS